MHKEIEAKLLNVDPQHIQLLLEKNGWRKESERTLFRRVVYHDPKGNDSSYLRLRDEWDRVTMTYKEVFDRYKLDGVRESEIEVSDFETAKQMLEHMGMKQKAYQETYRETRFFCGTMVTIDERPGIKPFIEVEWETQDKVEDAINKLWFDMANAVFWSVSEVYILELGMTAEQINNRPTITFENPPHAI